MQMTICCWNNYGLGHAEENRGTPPAQRGVFLIQSVREQHIDDGKDCDVMKIVSEIISEGAFQRLAIKKK